MQDFVTLTISQLANIDSVSQIPNANLFHYTYQKSHSLLPLDFIRKHILGTILLKVSGDKNAVTTSII